MKKLVLIFLLLFCFDAYATTTNYTTFADGNVLTASSLNNLQTWYTNAINATLNGESYTGDNKHLSGSKSIYCTDAACASYSAVIYGDSGKIIGAPYPNCKMSISGSTFSITGEGGSLSATNPCYIVIKDNTAGAKTPAKFIADVDVTFGAASDTDGNLLGITDANWADEMPLFIGIIADPTSGGSNNYFIISRLPFPTSGSAATDLCQLTDTDCDVEGDIMLLSTGLTLANYLNQPITQVGWIEGTYATAGGAWTFSLPLNSGFNELYKKIKYTFPVAQMGAAAGTYLLNNGGTAPVFSSQLYKYTISELVTAYINLSGDGGADGVGAVSTEISLPFKIKGDTLRSGSVYLDDQTNNERIAMFLPTTGTGYTRLKDSDGSTIQNADYTNGDRTISGTLIYHAFE